MKDLVKPHLSVSSLSMLTRCPKQWEFRYVYGIRNPPGVAAVVGTGVHGGIEVNLKEKILTGAMLPEDDVRGAAAEATQKAWEKDDPLLDEDERRLGVEKVRGGAVDKAVRLASLHYRQVAPGIEPVALEEGFRIEIPGLSHDVIGFKDIVEKKRIRDTKSTAKSPSGDEADKSIQLTCYDLDARIRGQSMALCLDYLVDLKTPKAVTLQTERTDADHREFLLRVETATRQIAAGVFPPTDPGSWACSERWCGYWWRCAHGAKQAVSVSVPIERLTSRIEVRR